MLVWVEVLPGCQAGRTSGATLNFKAKGRASPCRSKPSLTGKEAEGEGMDPAGSPVWELRLWPVQKAFLGWSGSIRGQLKGAGVREGARNRAEHSLLRPVLPLARRVGTQQTPDHRPAEVATACPLNTTRYPELHEEQFRGTKHTRSHLLNLYCYLSVSSKCEILLQNGLLAKPCLETAQSSAQEPEPACLAGVMKQGAQRHFGGHQLRDPSQSCQTEPQRECHPRSSNR